MNDPLRDQIALTVFSACYMALRDAEKRMPEGHQFEDIWTASAVDAYRLADAALKVRSNPQLMHADAQTEPSALSASQSSE